MNIDISSLLPFDFPADSRVWVYQCNRRFSLGEALQIEDLLHRFAESWLSHGVPVRGYANLFYGQFVVIIADETGHGVSGCSTDSSVRLIKEIEQRFQVNMFDRLLLAFLVKERVQMVPMAQLSYALENGFLDGSSLYFNNTVLNLQQFRDAWLIPVRNSWLAKDARYQAAIGRQENTKA